MFGQLRIKCLPTYVPSPIELRRCNSRPHPLHLPFNKNRLKIQRIFRVFLPLWLKKSLCKNFSFVENLKQFFSFCKKFCERKFLLNKFFSNSKVRTNMKSRKKLCRCPFPFFIPFKMECRMLATRKHQMKKPQL